MGIGLIPFGFFIKQVEPLAFFLLLEAGALTVIIGVSFILIARFIGRQLTKSDY